MRALSAAGAAELPSASVLVAYHNAGHVVAARALGHLSSGIGHARPRPKDAGFEDCLNFAAAGHAAERELACRSGLRGRSVVSNAGDDLEWCHRLIHEQTGEDHRDWILLHWTRAVARVTRLLIARWDEVVKLAELGRGDQSLVGACRSRTDAARGWWDEATRRRRDDRSHRRQ